MSNWDPREPIRLTGIDMPAAPQVPKNPAPWPVIALVAALVVIGGVGGFIFSGLGKPAGNGTAGPVAPTTTGAPPSDSPASPVTVPVDLLAGLPAPDYVDWVGESGGIAVFRMGYVSRAGMPGDYDYTNGGVGHEILRGVDAATGLVVWSNDQLPADSLVGSTTVADGKLALTLTEAAPGGGDTPWRCVAAGVKVLTVATGEVLSGLSTPVGADCWNGVWLEPAWTYSIMGYRDGLVALARGTVESPVGDVVVYRDSDLTKPLWRSDGSGRPPLETYQTEMMLPGGWILDPSGTYRSLRDGAVSKMTMHEQRRADGERDYNFFRGVGDRIVEATAITEHGASALSLIDPVTGARTWTYRLPDGWGASPWSCLVATKDSLVVRAQSLSSKEYVVSAINLATGQLRWSAPVGEELRDGGCQVLTRRGDQQVIAVGEVTGIELLDDTGAQIGAWGHGGETYFGGIAACGENLLCAGFWWASVSHETDGLRLAVLDYASDGLQVVFDDIGTSAGGKLNVVPTSLGQAVGLGHAAGGYEFLYF